MFLRKQLIFFTRHPGAQGRAPKGQFPPGLSSRSPSWGWSRCPQPMLGRGSGLYTLLGCCCPVSSGFPGVGGSGTWFPSSQVAHQSPGWWGGPILGRFPLTCVSCPGLPLLLRLFTQIRLLSTRWAEGLRSGSEIALEWGPVSWLEQLRVSTCHQPKCLFLPSSLLHPSILHFSTSLPPPTRPNSVQASSAPHPLCRWSPQGPTATLTSLVSTLAQLSLKLPSPFASMGPQQREYLTVTRGSWVTPHTMEAWVPLMTLWSWGGLVMRVRAERQQGDRVLRRGLDAE